jgi:hypothetical protein
MVVLMYNDVYERLIQLDFIDPVCIGFLFCSKHSRTKARRQ